MKKFLFFVLILLPITTSAYTMEVGDRLPTFKIVDQFDKEHVLPADTHTIIFTSSKRASEMIREFLLAQKKDFLKKNKAYYVVDILGMPSFVAKIFAIPKMKDFPFSILLVDEEQTKSFNRKDEHITLYSIENAKVSSIKYIQTKEELSNFF